jgi:hypothetical protein
MLLMWHRVVVAVQDQPGAGGGHGSAIARSWRHPASVPSRIRRLSDRRIDM